MNIPLDRLYHFIEDVSKRVCGLTVVIYRFWPNGSKKLQDLVPLSMQDQDGFVWVWRFQHPIMWCHDQEPLDYEAHANSNKPLPNDTWNKLLLELDLYRPTKSINRFNNIFDKSFLLHSELRSAEVEKYKLDNELIPVYYWSHALIARDWFRYAQHENFEKQTAKTFLIYNRAWSGTREYRVKFVDHLVEKKLFDQCLTKFNPVDPGTGCHYRDFEFLNQCWRPTHYLESYFGPNDASSDCSADFCTQDYKSTEIEIVLETLFDDARLHLTEKSLRPMACRQPFILAATAGSLSYLRSYGFQTFHSVWDETYDSIQDPAQRLEAVVELCQEIAGWDSSTRQRKITMARQIAAENQKHFFSKDFFDAIIDELQQNIKQAMDQFTAEVSCEKWHQRWSMLQQLPAIQNYLNNNQDTERPTQRQLDYLMNLVQTKYGVQT
jgi:hypothetical protein